MIAASPDQAQASVKAGSRLPTKRFGEKSSKVRKSCVDTAHIKIILGTMAVDQRDHLYAQFGEAYSAYRRVVAGWILDIGDYFSLHPTTTHAAVAYLDRLYLSKFSKREWQMLAISCILIAAKYNEREEDVPDLQTLEDIVKQPIPNEILLKYEMWALQKMGWKLNVHTPLAFIACYVACGVCHLGDTCSAVLPEGEESKVLGLHSSNLNSTISSEFLRDVLDARITDECYSLASVALLESSLKSYKASDIASAIVFYVRKSLCVVPVWTLELTALTRNDMRSEEMKNMHHLLRTLLPPVRWMTEEKEKDDASGRDQKLPTNQNTHTSTHTHNSANVTHSLTPTSASEPAPVSAPARSSTHSANRSDSPTPTHQHDPEATSVSDLISLAQNNEDISEYLSAALTPLELSHNSSTSIPMGPGPTQYPISLNSQRNLLPEVHTPLDNKENTCSEGGHVRPSPTSIVAMGSLVGI